MTSSSSSSKSLRALTVSVLASWLFVGTAQAGDPEDVTFPVYNFRSSDTAQKDEGRLWRATKKTYQTNFRAVVLVAADKKGTATLAEFAEELAGQGFDALVVTPREKKKHPQRALIEDIQSGVRYVKSKDVGATKALVVAVGQAANAGATLASGVRDMYLIIDGLVLVAPTPEERGMKLSDSLRQLVKLPTFVISARPEVLESVRGCPKLCRGLKATDGSKSIDSKKDIEAFLLKPHG